MTHHCPLNNLPCMRHCASQDMCQLALAHNAVNPNAAAELQTWWHVIPTPMRVYDLKTPRYDGSLDDWDVDHFTPPRPTVTSQIRAKLKALGIEFECGSYEEVSVTFHFPDGVTLVTEDWGNE